MTTVTIMNTGRMASAYAATLQQKGITLGTNPTEADLLLLSCYSGKESLALLQEIKVPAGLRIVDLTTQSLPQLAALENYTQSQGFVYYAGGVAGGCEQVGKQHFHIMLGATPIDETTQQIMQKLGVLHMYRHAKQAVSCKLLHNFYLIMLSHAQGAVLELAERYAVDDVCNLLDNGTAGRKPSATSVMRDRNKPPASSYDSGLVNKDISAIIESFPMLQKNKLADLQAIQQLHAQHAIQPFSKTINDYWRRLNET